MNEIQKMVSDYVKGKSPVVVYELESYLSAQGISKEGIKRVLVDEIVEKTIEQESRLLSPFDSKKLPYTLRYKTMSYDGDILVKEISRESTAGLLPSEPSDGLIPPIREHEGLIRSPAPVKIVLSREYFFRPTEEGKLRLLRLELYQ